MVAAAVPRPLTERQAEVLGFITRHIAERGVSPTVREIQRAFGLASPNGAAVHLRALHAKGAVVSEPRRPGTLVPAVRPKRIDTRLPYGGEVG